MSNTNQKPVTKKVSRPNRNTIAGKVGLMKTTNDWQQLETELKEAITAKDVFKVVIRMLSTRKHKVFTATKYSSKSGKPVGGKWIVQNSVEKEISFLPGWDTISEVRLTKKAIKSLVEKIKIIAKHGTCVLTLDTDAEGSPMYAMSVNVESICTGGGHNDATTYSTGLVFRRVTAIEELC